MDMTPEYAAILSQLSTDLSSSVESLLKLRMTLIPMLESELNDAKLNAHYQTISADVLRQYIQTSRDIQKLLFDTVSTHVLTIERLSDHILCRRKFLENNKPKPKVVETTTTVPATDIVSKIASMTAGMTPEQIEQFMSRIKSGIISIK